MESSEVVPINVLAMDAVRVPPCNVARLPVTVSAVSVIFAPVFTAVTDPVTFPTSAVMEAGESSSA